MSETNDPRDPLMTPTLPAASNSRPASESGAADASEAIGTNLSGCEPARYEMHGEHARGGLGRVIRATDRKLGRTVAIKELLDNEATSVARFKFEAQTAARLEHPSIVSVHEAGEWPDGTPFYTMKLISGEPLKELILSSDSLDERLKLLSSVIAASDAVAYAHNEGILHRDLKPSNILVGEFGETIVVDWGLAKDLRRSRDLEEAALSASSDDDALPVEMTLGGDVLGTPAYMSPEQARGEDVDERTDVYSLGALLYHVLAGRAPYQGVTSEEVLAKALDSAPEAVDKDVPVPAELVAIVEKAMEPDRRDRYASAHAFADDLKRFRDGKLVTAHAYPLHRRAAHYLRRYGRTLTLAATVVAVAGAVGLCGYRHHVEQKSIARCDAASEVIEGVWNASVRSSLARGFAASDAGSPSLVERVSPWFDQQTRSWKRDARTACLEANVHRRWDERQSAKASWCLEDRRLQMSALLARMTTPDADVARNAVGAAAGLSRTEDCIDERALAGTADAPVPALRPSVETIRELVAEAASMEVTGQYEPGFERATRAVAMAEELGVPSALAAALEKKASLLHELGKFEEAATLAQEAYMVAARSETWDVAALAATELIYYTGVALRRPDEGRRWAEHAAVAVSLAGDPLELREAGRLLNLSAVHGSSGDHIRARDAAERALAIRERTLGRDHPDVASSLNNAGNAHQTAGNYETAQAYFRRSAEIKAKHLGEQHPSTASTRENLAGALMLQGELEAAHDEYERALAVREAVLGPEHSHVGFSLIGYATAKLALKRPAEARPLFERARKIHAGVYDQGHLVLVYSTHGVGESLRMLGDHDGARRELEAALATVEKASPPDIRAQVQFSLARTLWSAASSDGPERARARTLAQAAHDILEKTGAEPKLRGEIATWLEASGTETR